MRLGEIVEKEREKERESESAVLSKQKRKIYTTKTGFRAKSKQKPGLALGVNNTG